MVDRVSADISLKDFQVFYLGYNKPCILPCNFTAKWRSRQEWVKNGKPNLSYLESAFGNCTVPVADCNQKQFNAHLKKKMLFKDFLGYWKQLSTSTNNELLYLKDWHFQSEFPEYKAYSVLEYFKSDWLNEFYDNGANGADDYRFVYMGPKGTWTSFHADVLRSYSWSANICGRKKWIIYPPGEENNLKDVFGNLPFDVTSNELESAEKFPNYVNALKPVEVIQEQGEVMFMPSCWYHQVHNLEDTISINHNWTNAYGIDFVFCHLQTELMLVQKEIGEFRDTEGWDEQCQLILKCTSGMDYQGFLNMLVVLMKPRYRLLKQSLKVMQKDKNASEEKEILSSVENELLEAFKCLDITCTAKEHLKYVDSVLHEDNFPEKYSEFELDACSLTVEERISGILFDLEKLVDNFQKVCQELHQTEEIASKYTLVSEIRELLDNFK